MKTKFYRFSQNNSGGSFDKELGYGLIVEAVDFNHANARAQDLGCYFDGVEQGVDCECCGDRWYPVYESDGNDNPTFYGDVHNDSGEPVIKFNLPIYIVYLDGRKEEFKK